MEKEYYIPEIEDFYIGYEFEFHHKTSGGSLFIDGTEINKYIEPHVEEWVKEKIITDPFLGRVMHYIVTPLKENLIRVPYLTREQIEAEGWLLSDNQVLLDDEGISILGISKSKTRLIDYRPKNQLLIIKKYGSTWLESDYVFNGICKSINEFRTICKYLRIK
jgi:hypothetical protein